MCDAILAKAEADYTQDTFLYNEKIRVGIMNEMKKSIFTSMHPIYVMMVSYYLFARLPSILSAQLLRSLLFTLTTPQSDLI